MKYGKLSRQLTALAGPIFIETLLVMMLGAVDTFMLSRYSDNSVAAVGVVNQLMNLVSLLFEVLPRNIYPLLPVFRSQEKGQGDPGSRYIIAVQSVLRIAPQPVSVLLRRKLPAYDGSQT